MASASYVADPEKCQPQKSKSRATKRHTVFLTGLETTYSRNSSQLNKTREPDKASQDGQEEWILQHSDDTTLSTVLSMDHEDALSTQDDVEWDVPRPISNCIHSGRLPPPVEPQKPQGSYIDHNDSEDDSGDGADSEDETTKKKKSHMKMRAGLAYAQYYGGHLFTAKETLKSFHGAIPESKTHVATAFLRLEIEVHLRYHKTAILKLEKIQAAFPKELPNIMPRIRLLLRLAFEMYMNRRYCGAILALRVASLAYRPRHPAEYSSVFRFLYTMVLEMSLRALNAQKPTTRRRLEHGNEYGYIIRCMCDVIRRMGEIQKFIPEDGDGRSESSERVKMIAECHNAVAFCCNSVGMYETADKEGTAKGMRKIEECPDASLRQCKVYSDLMLNKGISLLGRGMSHRAKYFFEMAIHQYKFAEDLRGADYFGRHDIARKNAEAADEFSG